MKKINIDKQVIYEKLRKHMLFAATSESCNFSNYHFIDKINISDFIFDEFDIKTIMFYNCVFDHVFKLDQKQQLKKVESLHFLGFSGCKIPNGISAIKDSHQIQKIYFSTKCEIGEISVANILCQEIEINSSSISTSLRIRNSSIKSLRIYLSNISLSITNCPNLEIIYANTLNNEILLSHSLNQIKSFTAFHQKYESLSYASNVQDNLLSLSTTCINHLNINRCMNSILNISDSEFNIFKVKNTRISVLEFSNISSTSSNSIFDLQNISSNNGIFHNINLKKFSIVNVFKSNFNSIEFSGISLPYKFTSKKNPTSKKTSENPNLYETYRMLKQNFISNGNQKLALAMHAKMNEVQRFQKELDWNEKIILWFNHWISRNGTNFFLPLQRLFILLLVTYFIYVQFLPAVFCHLNFSTPLMFNCIPADLMSALWGNLKAIFILANPAHRVSELEHVYREALNDPAAKLSKINYGISFFSRILVGLCYYHIILSFRKFSRKL